MTLYLSQFLLPSWGRSFLKNITLFTQINKGYIYILPNTDCRSYLVTGMLVLAFKYLKLFVTDMIGLFLTDVGQQVTYNSLNSRNDFFLNFLPGDQNFTKLCPYFYAALPWRSALKLPGNSTTFKIKWKPTHPQYTLKTSFF